MLAECFPCFFQDAPCQSKERGPPREAALRILSVNDVYKPERYAMLKTLVRRNRGTATTKLVIPGDLLGGSRWAVDSRGEAVVDVLNALEVDFCTLGNHEFDYGAERTRELMGMSKFTWLGSNVRENTAQKEIFCSTTDTQVFEVRGHGEVGTVKVGVFGICTLATPELSHPGPSIVFEPAVQHAARCVATLQERGCELIIALTHLSIAQDKELAEACPGIRVILGGHDHSPFLLLHRNTLIAKCGQNADHLGVLDLMFQREKGLPLRIEHSFSLLSTWNAAPDPGIAERIARWLKQDEDDVVCKVVDAALSTSTQELRTQENAFACHVADAILWSYGDQACDVAIQNGGFVRLDTSYPVGSALTAHDIREEMPFPKRPVLLEMSGLALRQGLEEMLAGVPEPRGSFPQLSRGFSVFYCPEAPKLKKIMHMEIKGKDLEAARLYRVAISEFYSLKPGDGVAAFTTGRLVGEHGRRISEVAVDYFRMKGSLSGELPGRLIVAEQYGIDRCAWRKAPPASVPVSRGP